MMKKRKGKLSDVPFRTTRSWLEADLPAVLEAQERYASFLPLCLGVVVGESGGVWLVCRQTSVSKCLLKFHGGVLLQVCLTC